MPPSSGSVSLETWLVEKEERVKLCQRLEYAIILESEYAGRGFDPNGAAAAVFFPSSSAHNQPSSVLPLFPLPSSTIPQHVEEEFVFPDSPIQPLGMYDYDQDEPLQPLDVFEYIEAVPEEEGEESEEGIQDVAEKNGDGGSALINLGSEDVNNDLEENFEMGSLEDLFEGEEEDDAEDAKKAGEQLEEMFAAAENSFEKADNDSREDVTNDTTTDVSEAGEEFGEEDDEPSQGDVGGTAIFDSIDLVRQAVEFLTVSS